MKTLSFLIICLFSISHSSVDTWSFGQTPAKNAEQDKQLRLKADLVELRAVVTDKRGQPVTGLKKDDFELLEENRPQEISFFSAEDVSIASGSQTSGSQTPGGVRSPRTPTENVARTIVLFVDTVHTSLVNVEQTKRALRRFVDEQMTDRDLVALVTSSGALGLMEQFTHDRRLLRAGIDRLAAWRASTEETLFSPYLAAQISRGDRRSLFLGIEIIRTEEMMPREVRDEIIEPQVRGKANQILAEASFRRKVMVNTLKGVVDRVAEMPGQRMIAVFSEGFSLAGIAGGPEPGDLTPAVNRAVRSGVVIYTIAAQGLQPMMIPASQPGTVAGRRRETPARVEVADLTSTMASAERDKQIGLVTLAKDTGGEAFFNSNDLSGRLQKALNDNRVYYAIAYHAQSDSPNEKGKQFRRISLRVKDHPEYKIRTQRGYQPLEVKAEEQPATPRQKLVQAMNAPLPVTTIPVAVSADYFERESLAGQAYIQIYIDANSLRYREQNNQYAFDLETAITIYDLTGKRVHISTNVANGSFTAERLEIAKRNGYRYTERVSLKPGVYQARIGVLEPATERVGTATGWLEVPDLTKGRLTLSAIMLTRDQAAASPPRLTNSSQVESLSPAVTQGIMIYNPGADLDYHLVIHPGVGKDVKAEGLMMQIEVAQSDRLVFQGQWVSIEPRVVEKDGKGIEVGGSLTLNGIKPGVYELRVSVKGPGSKKPVQRIASFGVEP